MKKIFLSMLFASSLFSFDQVVSLDELNSKISEGKVIIEFYQDWCHNCPEMARNLKRVDMTGFEVTKVYKKDGETYYDVKTSTNWSVADGKGKSVAGTSKGVMTLRKTDDGFKVSSIYTDKSR